MSPAEKSSSPVPAPQKTSPPLPRTLPAFLWMILSGMVRNIRGTVKGMVKGMIIAFAIVLVINTILQVTSLSQNDIAKSVIAAAGLSSSPDALLFWFLFTAILAFFWSQLVSRGVRSMLGRFGSMPRWILSSAHTTGSTGFPLVMAGIAVALTIRLFLLTNITGIQILILMFGILYSQQESLAILAMSLGYSDIHRLVRKRGPDIPPPGFPVMGVFGAFCGFLVVLFIADSLPVVAAAVLLMVAGSLVIWYRRRNTAAIAATPARAAGTGGKGS